MVQGCRPTSAVNHPVSVAIKPSGNELKVAHKNQRFRSSPPLVMKSVPNHARPSIKRPHPTIRRKAKNGISTGGRSATGKLVSPTSLLWRLKEPIKLPRYGIVSAYLLRSFA